MPGGTADTQADYVDANSNVFISDKDLLPQVAGFSAFALEGFDAAPAGCYDQSGDVTAGNIACSHPLEYIGYNDIQTSRANKDPLYSTSENDSLASICQSAKAVAGKVPPPPSGDTLSTYLESTPGVLGVTFGKVINFPISIIVTDQNGNVLGVNTTGQGYNGVPVSIPPLPIGTSSLNIAAYVVKLHNQPEHRWLQQFIQRPSNRIFNWAQLIFLLMGN